MRPDDVRHALDAMAAEQSDPTTDAGAVVARGRRRIAQRRLASLGVVAALVAVIATVGAVAHNRDTSAVTSVPPTSTTLVRGIPPITTLPTTPTDTSAPRAPSPLAFATATEGWICGNPMTYTSASFDQLQSGTESIAIPAAGRSRLGGPSQPPLCAAVPGGNVWMLRGSTDPNRPEIVHIGDGATTERVFPFPTISHALVSSLDFTDASSGWAVVEFAHGTDLYRTRDGGGTWARVLRDAPIGAQIDFEGTNVGWASGYALPDLARTTDGAQTWQQVRVPTPHAQLYRETRPVLVDGNVIVAQGAASDGVSIAPFFDVSLDGGGSWSLRAGPSGIAVPTTVPIAFSAADADHWALGWSNHLYLTDDGGRTWAERAQFAGLATMHFVARPSASTLVVSGNGDAANETTVALASVDGGDTWATVDSSAPPLASNAKVVNFPGGIIGCPTHPLASPPPGNPPPGLVGAAYAYVTAVRHWQPASSVAYPVDAAHPTGAYGLFKFQLPSCGGATMQNAWVVEVVGVPGKGGGGSTEQTQLALSYSADGWHVFGSYH